MKDLPALVQRELSRALAIAGSAIEHDVSRKQYLSQVRVLENMYPKNENCWKTVGVREVSILERCLY